MDNLNNIPNAGNWGDAASKLNDNFNKIKQAVTTVENTTKNNKGYFTSLSALNTAFPSPKAGQTAYVYGEASSTKYYIYNAVNGAWVASSIEAPSVGVAIEGYTKTGGSTKTTKEVEDDLELKANQTDLELKANQADLEQLEDEKLDREYGYTYFNNKVVNGDFSEGLLGWIIGSSITDATVGDDGLTWTAKRVSDGAVNQVSAPALLDSKLMYVRFKAKRNSDSESGAIRSSFGYSSPTTHVLTREFKQYSAIIVNNNANSGRIVFGTNRPEDELNVTISNVICIDLTKSFHAGNYPSKSTLDSAFLNYEYFNDLEFPSIMNSITGLSLIDDKISKADFFHEVNNETVNGDFSNELTGWSTGSNITDAVVGVDGLTWTAKSRTYGMNNHVLANFVLENNIYFLAFKAKRNNSNDHNYFSVSIGYASTNQLLLSENLEYYYIIISAPDSPNARITFSSIEDGLNVTLKDVVSVNLTSIYGENIPDLNQLINLFGGNYFDTTCAPKFSTGSGSELSSFMTEENETWNV